MKLGELRAAIRGAKDGVSVMTDTGMEVLVQKGSLLNALGAKFGSKSEETGLSLNDGLLLRDGDTMLRVPVTSEAVAAICNAQIDLEDYIADEDDDLIG